MNSYGDVLGIALEESPGVPLFLYTAFILMLFLAYFGAFVTFVPPGMKLPQGGGFAFKRLRIAIWFE
jgi:hypothetical protein